MPKEEDHNLHPHWVVVTRSDHNPPKYKYVFGFKSHAEAERERQRRQDIEDERVKLATVRRIEQNKQRKSVGILELPPVYTFTYAVIKRPVAGWLG